MPEQVAAFIQAGGQAGRGGGGRSAAGRVLVAPAGGPVAETKLCAGAPPALAPDGTRSATAAGLSGSLPVRRVICGQLARGAGAVPVFAAANTRSAR